jgi:hypothetical protein
MNDGLRPAIPYALVVSGANDSPDLYNKIAQRYGTILEPVPARKSICPPSRTIQPGI